MFRKVILVALTLLVLPLASADAQGWGSVRYRPYHYGCYRPYYRPAVGIYVTPAPVYTVPPVVVRPAPVVVTPVPLYGQPAPPLAIYPPTTVAPVPPPGY